MKDKWLCSKCGKEITEKPYKNQCCKCKGRFVHYRQCDCGQWFLDKKYDKKYCSDNCRGYLTTSKKHKPVTLVCECCGKEFIRYFGNIKNPKHTFCSKECKLNYFKADIQIRKCLNCGKEFKIYNSVLSGKTNAKGNYCCTKCYYDSMRFLESPHRYGKEFKQNKKKYFDKSFCVFCGTTKNIHIHHIIPFRLTKDNGLDNLVPLCAKHHKKFENLTRNIVDSAKDYEIIKFMLRNILDEHKYATMYLLDKIKKDLKNGNSKHQNK